MQNAYRLKFVQEFASWLISYGFECNSASFPGIGVYPMYVFKCFCCGFNLQFFGSNLNQYISRIVTRIRKFFWHLFYTFDLHRFSLGFECNSAWFSSLFKKVNNIIMLTYVFVKCSFLFQVKLFFAINSFLLWLVAHPAICAHDCFISICCTFGSRLTLM